MSIIAQAQVFHPWNFCLESVSVAAMLNLGMLQMSFQGGAVMYWLPCMLSCW